MSTLREKIRSNRVVLLMSFADDDYERNTQIFDLIVGFRIPNNDFVFLDINDHQELEDDREFLKMFSLVTRPFLFINGIYRGDYFAIMRLFRSGRLENLLRESSAPQGSPGSNTSSSSSSSPSPPPSP